MRMRQLSTALLLLALTACATTTRTSRTWGEAGPRRGQVTWIRETVERQEGNPAGGAAVGAVIGGLLGHAIIGHSGGTMVGAVGGAAAGAAASQNEERRSYEVAVRFDDGERRVFVYRDYSPFRVGDVVVWTPSGLGLSHRAAQAQPYPPPPQTYSPPPPPGSAQPPAPGGAATGAPPGEGPPGYTPPPPDAYPPPQR